MKRAQNINSKGGPKAPQNKPKKKKKKSKVLPQPALVSVPVAKARGFKNSAPIVQGGFATTRIRHRELVASLETPGNSYAVNLILPVNPGMPTTFPWLSTQARGWEKYRFHSLRFEYLTRCGSNTLGSIMMVPDYDAADPPPATEAIAGTYADMIEDVPWKDKTLHMRNLQGLRFVRTQALSPNLDIKTYDLANLFICSANTSNSAPGKLFVVYDIELSIPQTIAPFVVGGSLSGSGTMSNLNPLGTTGTLNAQSAGIRRGEPNTSSLLTFDRIGQYLLTSTLQGGSITNAGSPAVTVGSASVSPIGAINAAQTLGMVKSEVNVTSAPTILDLANGIIASTVSGYHIDVASAPPLSL